MKNSNHYDIDLHYLLPFDSHANILLKFESNDSPFDQIPIKVPLTLNYCPNTIGCHVQLSKLNVLFLVSNNCSSS